MERPVRVLDVKKNEVLNNTTIPTQQFRNTYLTGQKLTEARRSSQRKVEPRSRTAVNGGGTWLTRIAGLSSDEAEERIVQPPRLEAQCFSEMQSQIAIVDLKVGSRSVEPFPPKRRRWNAEKRRRIIWVGSHHFTSSGLVRPSTGQHAIAACFVCF
ncbi:hypothetical protein RJT34_23446 [Clitoria ternatea]|uniref:Uncharacterized protein n=1 Tax=Clitoria ternatea TaxID=43366 RepID=A0AAN9FUQ9_CLITE